MSQNNHNFLNVYNASAQFMPHYWFIELYNEIPSRYDLETVDEDQRMCLKDVDIEKDILPLFKHVDDYRITSWSELPSKEDEPDTEKSGLEFQIAADNMVITVDKKMVTIYYHHVLNVEEVANKVYNVIPKYKEKETKGKVNLINVYQGDYYSMPCKIDQTNVIIEENYNDDFLPVYDDVISFLQNRSSGLVLLFGTCGTGKTNLIRHLINTQPHDYIIVPSSIAAHLGDPDLVSFITSNKDSVFILEDCEQLLEDREDNSFNTAISTILNMADGLLSDITNIKFICTFNANISNIDKALLRKGRCIAKYEFSKMNIKFSGIIY